MKKCARLIFAGVIIGVLSFALFAQAGESTPQMRRKTFEQVWKIVNERFFDPAFCGVNWNEVRARYSPLVAAAQNDAELYRQLSKMLGEIRISHLEILPPEMLENAKGPPVSTGLGIREIEGQVVVFRILKNSSAAASAIRPGHVVKTIDGVAVAGLDDAREKLAGKANTKLALGFLNEKDELQEAALERRQFQPGEIDKQSFGKDVALYALFESRRLVDGIGYIQFTSFITPLQAKVRIVLRSMKDAPGIIIDLRGNGGGDDAVGIEMASAFFEKKTVLMVSRTRKGDDDYYAARSNKDPYTGKVAILLDSGSASASEQFAAGMQEAGRAVVIGNKTKGDDMDADVRPLPTGALLLYPFGQPRTPKGIIIEGRGVIPDIEVNLTRKGLLSGKDEQLEAAIEYIRGQKPGP